MAVCKNQIVAIGNNLQHDVDFSGYEKIDLKGNTVTPGLVDAHTHIFFYALSLNRVSLSGVKSIKACLDKITEYVSGLKKNAWVLGEGYAPDNFTRREEPDRLMLDKVTGDHPALIYSKDEHSAWVNTKALEIAGINENTRDPKGGEIVRFENGTPSGILRENPAIGLVYGLVPPPSSQEIDSGWEKALDIAYRKGVTGVHSFDDRLAFISFSDRAQKNKLGLRINYYAPGDTIDDLIASKTYFGLGNDFLRVVGIKLFADGSLGSQTALCFNKYLGSKDKYGIEVTPPAEIAKKIKKAAKLGLPVAVHAIGDKAIANLLDVFETAPALHFGARHRIEHLQLIRRKDVARLKKLGITASMQPSHCPADIEMCRNYWGKRSANAYMFRTLIDKKIPLTFGSDVPIEPLDPLVGIEAAVRRARPGSRDVFYPEQRITPAEALYGFTAGTAYAVGQEYRRGMLLPGYPADYIVLSHDILKCAPTKISQTKVLATVLDGKLKYCDNALSL